MKICYTLNNVLGMTLNSSVVFLGMTLNASVVVQGMTDKLRPCMLFWAYG